MCGRPTGTALDKTFDPTRCPLLQGLTLEEADELIRTDPRIRSCIAAIADGAAEPEPCPSDRGAAVTVQ